MIAIGLKFEEGRAINNNTSNAVIGLVGTAANAANLNKPMLIKSLQQGVTEYGLPTAGATIPDALAIAYERYGQITFIVINVAPATALAVVAANFNWDAQDRIQLPHRSVTAVVVKNVAGTTTYVSGTDYTLDAARGLISRKGTTIPKTDPVSIAYSRPDFSAVTATNIIGGVNATTGKREGLEALIDAEFVDVANTNVKMILTPGYSQLAGVADKLKDVSDRIRAIYFLDAPASATVDEVIAGRNSGAAPVALFATKHLRAMLCYPNPITDKGEEWFSTHLACSMAIMPEWKAPTNNNIRGVLSWKTRLLTSASDPLADNVRLNNVGVTTHFNRSGQDVVVWGHFNASYPEQAPEKFGFDRVHIVRIIDSAYDQINRELSRFIGQRLGVNWDGVIATIEASVAQTLRANESIDNAVLNWLPELSSLPNRKLAFRLALQIPDALDLIITTLEFNI